MPHLILTARPPFRFESVIHSHGWYQLAPHHWAPEAGRFQTVERLSTGRVVTVAMTGRPAGLEARVPGRLTRAEQAELTHRLTRMFSLEADFSGFYALADQEPRLAHCRPLAFGRLLRSSELFDDVVKVMLTTNIQWAGTRRLAAALVKHYGEAAPEAPAQRAFPTAERIARSREATLRRLGLGYRAPYLLQLARGVAGGAVDLAAITAPERPTALVRKDLLRLPGIGPYAAATLLGLLGRYDHIGVDTEALSAVSRGFHGGRPVEAKDVHAAFERWGPYQALAYWFWDYDGQYQGPLTDEA